MIVYVESNFVLEIALGQEQSTAAETILQRAETGAIDLAFPAVAVTEQIAAITRGSRERRRLQTLFDEQVRQLARSTSHQGDVATLRQLPLALTAIEQRELAGVLATLDRLLRAGRSLHFDASMYARALDRRARYSLTPQDAFVLTSILEDLPTRDPSERKALVSRDWGDFGQDDLRAELRAFNCTYIANFGRGLRFLAAP